MKGFSITTNVYNYEPMTFEYGIDQITEVNWEGATEITLQWNPNDITYMDMVITSFDQTKSVYVSAYLQNGVPQADVYFRQLQPSAQLVWIFNGAWEAVGPPS